METDAIAAVSILVFADTGRKGIFFTAGFYEERNGKRHINSQE
jgi:hypothetical protein